MERTAIGSRLLGDELTACLESLRAQTGAASARLLHWPEEVHCGHSDRALPEEGTVTVCTPGEDRPCLLAGAEPIAAVPGGCAVAVVGLCAMRRLVGGGGLALQLDLSGPLAPREADGGLAVMLLPVLMWAAETLEREAAEARLAELLRRNQASLQEAVKAHEQDRERLAYEVHDRIAQTLASVFQQLQALEALAHSSPDIRRIAVRSSMLTREAIREARNIMNDLHPPVLDELGLAPLVEEELRRLAEETGCRTRALVTPGVRLTSETEIVLYRILHEALINIRRHALATEVDVSLEYDRDEVRLQVWDNGVGFDVAAALARKRVGGLLSLRRRAELAGGFCGLESSPGKGTTIRVWLPRAGDKEGG